MSTAYIIEELIRKRKEKIKFKENLKEALPYIGIFLLPMVWYFVVKQHSGTHHFLTYRLLSISIINLFIIIKTIFKSEEIEEKLSNKEKIKKVKK
jgi:hypothetical protein